MKDSSSKKLQELEAQNKELGATLGRKQIQLDHLEKMIELAQSKRDTDIKKNYSTPQSTGSGKTKPQYIVLSCKKCLK